MRNVTTSLAAESPLAARLEARRYADIAAEELTCRPRDTVVSVSLSLAGRLNQRVCSFPTRVSLPVIQPQDVRDLLSETADSPIPFAHELGVVRSGCGHTTHEGRASNALGAVGDQVARFLPAFPDGGRSGPGTAEARGRHAAGRLDPGQFHY